ncbi:MAG: hypothetical protein M1838_000914 [Thelocarpon superellum]|nr:MAG: hypothetical protein M1838_000914 [Thelocarpon superellum]
MERAGSSPPEPSEAPSSLPLDLLTGVQIAIAKFFDGETADPVAEARASLDHASPPRPSVYRETLLNGSSSFDRASGAPAEHDLAPRVVPQPESQIHQSPSFLLSLLLTPLSLLYRLIASSFGLFTYLFPFLPRWFPTRLTSRRGGAGAARNTTGRRALSPRDAAARFIREFEEDHGSHALPFVESGYAQALDTAKKDLKFLLVLLFSPEHDDTDAFIRQTLLSREIVDLVTDARNNIIVWAGSVQDSEAYQVSTALTCTKFPFAALISHTPGTSSTAMSVVARIVGPVPAAAFVAELRGTVAKHGPPLQELRASRAARQSERTLREEQNSAYERSLAQDRERARRKRELEAAEAERARQAHARAEARATLARRRLQWKLWRCQSLAPEPAADAKETTRISVRLPSGERVMRKFAPEAPMEHLYAFVECYDVFPALTDGANAIDAPPADYEHHYAFQLVSPVPRIVYGLDDGGSVGKRVGRSANLIVESLDEDDDDEADEVLDEKHLA